MPLMTGEVAGGRKATRREVPSAADGIFENPGWINPVVLDATFSSMDENDDTDEVSPELDRWYEGEDR